MVSLPSEILSITSGTVAAPLAEVLQQRRSRWPSFKAVRKTEGRTTADTRHCIVSRRMAPEEFLKAVRNR